MRIIIADDHQIFIDGLKMLLQKRDDIKIIAEVGTANELTIEVERSQPDLILLDYSMPDGNSLSTVKFIKNKYPNIMIVVLTAAHSPIILQSLIDSKIDGLVLKDDSATELLKTITYVEAGQRYISTSVKTFATDINLKLTARELQVLTLLNRGKRRLDIAQHLSISGETVKFHTKNLMKKLKVTTSNELISRIDELKLLK